jgi:signal-transduction protein with cAMP-binding, CBS, and nucleotidyltransferase domain
VDNVVYGPVPLSLLIEWIEDERVTADTWVFKQSRETWQKAGQMDELKEWFTTITAEVFSAGSLFAAPPPIAQFKTGALRRIKILSTLDEAQLEQFRGHLQLTPVKQWAVILKQGDPADGLYMIIEGEVRVRLLSEGKETIVATLETGDFFGELSLFDQGPRSADVVANTDSVLFKLPSGEFQKMVAAEPKLAAPFLMAVCKTVSARMRADNKRYANSLNMARFAVAR